MLFIGLALKVPKRIGSKKSISYFSKGLFSPVIREGMKIVFILH